MSEEPHVLFESSDGIAVVTLNRPRAFNSITSTMVTELGEILDRVARDVTVRGVIITGATRAAFAAGADIQEILDISSPERSLELSRNGHRVYRQIEKLGKPVIAALNGLALGGGLELALCCTLRVASDRGKFGLPEINLGILPGYGGTQRLPRFVGRGRAFRMILTGEPITAEEALAIGLVDVVVPRDEVLEAARSLMRGIIQKAPRAVEAVLAAVHKSFELPLDEGLAFEAETFSRLRGTRDSDEGLRAHLEKRSPRFTGE